MVTVVGWGKDLTVGGRKQTDISLSAPFVLLICLLSCAGIAYSRGIPLSKGSEMLEIVTLFDHRTMGALNSPAQRFRPL